MCDCIKNRNHNKDQQNTRMIKLLIAQQWINVEIFDQPKIEKYFIVVNKMMEKAMGKLI